MKVNNTVSFCTHFGEDSFLHDSPRKRLKEIEDASITPVQKRHKELEDSFTLTSEPDDITDSSQFDIGKVNVTCTVCCVNT